MKRAKWAPHSIKELRGGPMNGHEVELKCSYLDAKGNPVPTPTGDTIRRSGKGGLYYLRGAYYEWNNR